MLVSVIVADLLVPPGNRLKKLYGETISHFWGSEVFYAPTDPGQEPRHVGTIEPLWNLFDLNPEGRGNRLG